MLVLSRKVDESLVTILNREALEQLLAAITAQEEALAENNDDSVAVVKLTTTVVDIRGDKIRLGCDAPRCVAVHRSEVWDDIKNEQSTVEATVGQHTQ